MKKLIVKVLKFIMCKRGYSPYLAVDLIKDVIKDLFKNKENTLREKIWAYKRGFLSPKIRDYGLTEANYKLFVSDFDYNKLYPINNEFRKWIDDKLTTRFILYPYSEYFPKYHFHIKNKDLILRFDDCTSKHTVKDILDLLTEEKNLALKLLSGTYGIGFYKISYRDNTFYINENTVEEARIISLLNNLKDYLVTEYITAHSDIRRIYEHAPNALRVMVINEYGREPYVAAAFIRFGTKTTGVIDNGSAGAVFSIVDIKTGKYFDSKKMENNRVMKCEIHPDSKCIVEGVLPHWELIKTKLIEISKYICEVTYMGFDVVITEEGFKILEINSHQGIVPFQFYYPLLADNAAAPFFKKLLNERAGWTN